MKKTTSARYIFTAALIASLYAALTYVSSAFGLAYASLQFRLSEALNILAAFTPAAIPGLTIGCVISNITSPFGVVDIILGALATFLSTILIRMISKQDSCLAPFLMSLPPALLNGLIVGFESALFADDGALITIFLISAIQVFVSEIVVCLALGIPLYNLLKNKLKNLF